MRRPAVREAPGSYRPDTSEVVLCDVNILVAAGRPEHPHHQLANRELQALFDADGAFGCATHLLAAMVRICTNPRVFPEPTPPADAFRAVDAYRGYARAIRIEPGRDHWRIFQSLVIGAGLTGGATSDAWHAALAIEHGCTWWTFDRDFTVQRFPGLRLRLLET